MAKKESTEVKSQADEMSNLFIIIEINGLVNVGVLREGNDAFLVDCEKCATIRIWGTSAGLGELAQKGPLPQTTLDRKGNVRINKMHVIEIIECHDNAGWHKYLNDFSKEYPYANKE